MGGLRGNEEGLGELSIQVGNDCNESKNTDYGGGDGILFWLDFNNFNDW